MVIASPALLSREAIWARLASVPDPEIPVISIVDLGIVRGVEVDDAGVCTVTLTPTYSGCPATEVIATDVRQVISSMVPRRARLNTAALIVANLLIISNRTKLLNQIHP
jgi:ring-1,2-phenylacetyl-CoA epoxidase subunit PaaD